MCLSLPGTAQLTLCLSGQGTEGCRVPLAWHHRYGLFVCVEKGRDQPGLLTGLDGSSRPETGTRHGTPTTTRLGSGHTQTLTTAHTTSIHPHSPPPSFSLTHTYTHMHTHS